MVLVVTKYAANCFTNHFVEVISRTTSCIRAL
jgi:hypothetical protein